MAWSAHWPLPRAYACRDAALADRIDTSDGPVPIRPPPPAAAHHVLHAAVRGVRSGRRHDDPPPRCQPSHPASVPRRCSDVRSLGATARHCGTSCSHGMCSYRSSSRPTSAWTRWTCRSAGSFVTAMRTRTPWCGSQRHFARMASRAQPKHVARLVERVMTLPRPALRYPLGTRSCLLPLVKAVLPQGVFEWAVRRHLHLPDSRHATSS